MDDRGVREPPCEERRSKGPAYLVLGLLLMLGAVLRLAQYLHNRELWSDEAWLANEIMAKSFGELTGVLRYTMNYPIGFLLSVKSVVSVFGTSEYAFRLFPLICGLLALGLFAALAMRVERVCALRGARWAPVLVAVALFALSKHLIYYASEMRHYSTDALVVCLLYLLAPVPLTDERPGRRIVAMTLVGVATVWLSLTAVFVLASIGITYFLACGWRQQWRPALWMAVGCGVCALSFLVHFHLMSEHIAAQGQVENLRNYCAHVSLPLPPKAWIDFRWCRDAFERMFYLPGGMTYLGLAMFVYLAGCVSFWRRRRAVFFMMVLPLAFVILASSMHRYPFRGRYLLFLTPCLFLTMAEGVGFFLDKSLCKSRAVGVVLLAMLVAQPFAHSMKVLVEPRSGPGGPEEIKPLMAHLRTHWQEGDVLYLHFSQYAPFVYYAPQYGFAETDYVAGMVPKFNTRIPATFSFDPPEGRDTPKRFWLLYLGRDAPRDVAEALVEKGCTGKAREETHSISGTLVLYPWDCGGAGNDAT